jgi:hypothetical protein
VSAVNSSTANAIRKAKVMLANPQPQPQSRWTAFVERWDQRLERFRKLFDPFSESTDNRMKTWVIVALSIAFVTLAALVVLGVMWIIDHHKWVLVYPMLKIALKLFGLGALIVAGLAFKDRLAKMPFFQRFQGRSAARPNEKSW